MKLYLSIAALTAAALVSSVALAQEAVPLTEDLFTHSWVIVNHEGQTSTEGSTAATLNVFDLQAGDVGGDTDCGYSWNAKINIDLPAVKFTDVDAFYTDECPAYRNTISLIAALERVTHAQTSPEGLELIDIDGQRLLLLNAGG